MQKLKIIIKKDDTYVKLNNTSQMTLQWNPALRPPR